jgi:hypothetical protein
LFKHKFNNLLIKAGILTCLFYFVINVHAQTSTRHKTAFDLLLQLEYQKASEIISGESKKNAIDYYYLSLIASVELMVEQDRSKIATLLANTDTYLKELTNFNHEQAILVRAEIEMHRAIVYALNEQEFYAALSFRQSFVNTRTALSKYPDNKEFYKTAGIQLILLGSAPEKYDWILSLLGMHGDVNKGLDYLKSLNMRSSPTGTEALIWKSLLMNFVLHEGATATETLLNYYQTEKQYKLIALLAGILSIKNSNSEKAIELLQQKSMPVIASYHLGEALLHKGLYADALQAYQHYINNSKSIQLIKDAYFKSGLCALFLQNELQANFYFTQAKVKGNTTVEADKYAASVLSNNEPINLALQKLRFFTDGGYFNKAEEHLKRITQQDLFSEKDQVELHYRKARLKHKSGNISLAILEYKEVIQKSGSDSWYFAPNSALQLGYIYEEKGDMEKATYYYNLALTYKKHEYKNSIDGKARSALGQLNPNK